MQKFEGTITRITTPQTVAVEVIFFTKHPKYKKVLKKTTELLVHNDGLELKAGDRVEIVKSKPYSKFKHFRVSGKLK